MEATKIALFKGRKIRKTIHNNEWWFVIVDVVAALTDSLQPDGYLKDMRRRDLELSKGWGQIATPLFIKTEEDQIDEMVYALYDLTPEEIAIVEGKR